MAKRKKYGCPYRGSKSTIAERIIGLLPSATHLYDIFAGGCAVTHAALLSGKWKYIHANDISDTPQLFWDAIHGKYKDEKRWISREDFFALKDSDPYVRTSWSFGNGVRTYLYSRIIEPYKKACHYAIVLNEWEQLAELCPEVVDACKSALEGITDTKQRRLAFGPTVVKWLKAYGTDEMVANNPLYNSCHTKKDTPTRKKGATRDLQRLRRLQSLESLERLESLQSLESLERLESLQSLEITRLDYRKARYLGDSIIYADPPYNTTKEKCYNVAFDHNAFYDWAAQQEIPLFISEYNISDDRFVEVASIDKLCSMASTTSVVKQEKIYIPRHQQGMIAEMINKQIWGGNGISLAND